MENGDEGKGMKKNYNENPYLECWIEDGILYGKYKIQKLNLEIARECANLRIEVCGGANYPALADVSSVKSITKDAREYLAGDAGTSYITASAMIIDSSVGKIMGNFYLKINKPKIPLKIFTDRNEALDWLKQFV